MTGAAVAVGEKNLRIADIEIRVRSSIPELWPHADRRYRDFYVAGSTRPDETIEVSLGADAEDLARPPSYTSFELCDDGRMVRVMRGTSTAEWDRRSHVCRTRQAQHEFAKRALFPEAACDSVVRTMVSVLAVERDGMLLHAAGLVRGGKGYLFVGRSGAGKSTISEASASRATILSDDLVLARIRKDGVYIHGTPFFGKSEIPGTNLEAPLAGIYFLCKAERDAVRPVDARWALPRLMRSLVLPARDAEATGTALGLAMNLCRRVPCRELEFVKGASFWRCIDA